MADLKLLREKLEESGKSIEEIAFCCGVSHTTIYNKMSGKREFKASEITKLSKLLKLTKAERDRIFLS